MISTHAGAGKALWKPQPRPDWVSQLNEIGDNAGDPAAIVDLSESSLLETAMRTTGLDDFGPESWREGYHRLLSEIDRTARLNLVGRIIARSEILRSLRARLMMAQAYKEHPEIADEEVANPVFITGMGRSGTSVLHELFAEDPEFRVPLTWELLYPSPPPEALTRATDPRIAMADADHTLWHKVCPEYRTMHDNRGDGPNECILGTMHEFVSQVWSFANNVPEYDKWLLVSEDAIPNSYSFHRYLLKLLQFRAPGRWMLKAPTHLNFLPALFNEYPDAHVIITHRDPLKTLPSLCSLVATMRRQRSDHVNYDLIVKMMSRGNAYMLDAMIAARDSATLPADRIIDVRYPDLMADPVGTLGLAYEKLGMSLTNDAAQRVRGYLDAKPKGRLGTHDYSFEDMGLDYAEVRAAFRNYQERFELENEV